MKKLLFLLFPLYCFGQVDQPNTSTQFQQFGSATTWTRINGVVYAFKGFVMAEYASLASANASSIAASPGAVIRVGNLAYYRNSTATAWNELGLASAIVYPSTGIAVSTGSAWGVSITDNSANWNTAFTDRLKWDGGATGLIAATGRTSLGITTIGDAYFRQTNPGAVTYIRQNADNTISALDAATFRTAIGAGTGSGTVTGSGTLNYLPKWTPNGITLGNSLSTDDGTTFTIGNAATYVTYLRVTGTGDPNVGGFGDNAIRLLRTVDLDRDSHGIMDISTIRANSGLSVGYAAFDALPQLNSPSGYNYREVTSFQARPNIITTGTIGQVYGLYSSPDLSGVTATSVVGAVASEYTNFISPSTVTNQVGFYVSPMSKATNNYGFWGNIDVGSNRYNLYMSGTANNYLAGKLGIGTLTPDSLLTLTGGGLYANRGVRFSGLPTGGTVYKTVRITSNGTLIATDTAAAVAQVYPGAGIPQSTGSAWGTSITPGTGVVTALGVNIGSSGAFVTLGGALGTPSSGTVTNLTGTASININGTVGATTPTTGAFTTVTASTSVTTPLIVGNGGTTTPINYKVTTGVGSTGADHIFLVGNNGATEAMRILNSGAVNIGMTTGTRKLSVNTIAGFYDSGNTEQMYISAGTGGIDMYAYQSPSSSRGFRIDTRTGAGNTQSFISSTFFGLNTTNPTAGLEVAKNAATSLSNTLLSGTWFSGGSATTTKPFMLIEPTGTTSTAWSTSGTGLGVNAASGFTGNLLDYQIAASRKFAVNSVGKITISTGANTSTGQATLVGGTVTVNNTAVTASSLIYFTVATPGGTQGFLSVGTIVAATSFVINSTSATETSVVNFWIIN